MPLDTPPQVIYASASIHGQQRRRDSYVLHDLWAIHLYLSSTQFSVQGQTYQLQPGDVSLTPAGQRSTYEWDKPCELLGSHFRSPKHTSGNGLKMSVVTLVKDDLGRWRDQMEAIIAAPSSPKSSAILWTLLWDLRDRATRKSPTVDPILQRAMAWIELNLNESFRIEELTDVTEISHAYLGRLFRKHHQMTIVAYVQARRAQRARHLLEHTTQPAKAIASQVGMPDLQRLNKLLHQAYGHGPRWFR
ncbi:MAG: helix-turn-helix domain-containing protein [Phycisphaeraceae bacterium]|nr:helix-turn-helix domain-containing protein [Phycisphaeraceae bacterium]